MCKECESQGRICDQCKAATEEVAKVYGNGDVKR